MERSQQEPQLARACLDHLRFEESELHALRDNLESLHRAVLAGDMKTVAAITSPRSGLPDYRDRTDRARESFCRTAATAMGLAPFKVNVDRIAADVPEPWRHQIRESSARVARLAADIRAQSRRTAVILACCRTMARQILADIGGIGNNVDRYGPSGAPVDEGRPDSRLVTGTM